VKAGDLVQDRKDGTIALITGIPSEHFNWYTIFYITGDVAGEEVIECPLSTLSLDVISCASPRKIC